MEISHNRLAQMKKNCRFERGGFDNKVRSGDFGNCGDLGVLNNGNGRSNAK